MIDLQRIIKHLKITQGDFSSKLGVSQSAVSQVCSGKIKMPDAWNEKIQEVFNLDISNFHLSNELILSDTVLNYENENKSKLGEALVNLSQSNKIMSESNKSLSESNKILSESIQKAIELQKKLIEHLTELRAITN